MEIKQLGQCVLVSVCFFSCGIRIVDFKSKEICWYMGIPEWVKFSYEWRSLGGCGSALERGSRFNVISHAESWAIKNHGQSD